MEMGDDDDGNVNRKVQSIVPLSHIRTVWMVALWHLQTVLHLI